MVLKLMMLDGGMNGTSGLDAFKAFQ